MDIDPQFRRPAYLGPVLVGFARWLGASAVLLALSALVLFLSENCANANDAPSAASTYPSIESERLRPNPIEHLSVPSIPGKQAVILYEYQPTIPESQRIGPILLQLPDNYFAKVGMGPLHAWGLNFILQYPSMTPLRVATRTCDRGWCPDEFLLHIEINRRPKAEAAFNALRHSMADAAAKESPAIKYTRLDVPAGFSAAYAEIPQVLPESFTKWDFVLLGADGSVFSFIQCQPKEPNPTCQSSIRSQLNSHVDVEFSFNMAYWAEREKFTAAVQTLVNSFNPMSVAAP
jgi:hypothetical protein